MNRDIKKRKIRFWAFLLALVLMLPCAPITVEAKVLTDSDLDAISDGILTEIYPGDVCALYSYAVYPYTGPYIEYYRSDGNTLMKRDVLSTSAGTYTIRSYRDMPTEEQESGMAVQFRCWKIEDKYVSGGGIGKLILTPVPWVTKNITYYVNGAENNDAGNPTTYRVGEGLSFSSFNKPTRTGYTFVGWYEDEHFTGSAVTSISTDRDEDVTLYAKFEANKHNITYELDGGTNGAGNPATYDYGIGVQNLAAASKTGYTFEGWYENEHFTGSAVTSISTDRDEDVTLHAKFEANKHNITYELDGGTNGEGNPATYDYGIGVPNLAAASKTGYTFGGWYENEHFTGEKVTGISTTRDEAVNLYAKFDVASYGITYELDGGTNGEGNPATYDYGIGVPNLADASKTGYTFKGWYESAAFTGNKVTSISTTRAEAVTLYAKFEANMHNITYELDGGTNGAGNPNTYFYGIGVPNLAAASKTGYTFEGWYEDEHFTGEKVTSVSTTRDEAVTLYAKFTEAPAGSADPATYQITYQLDGGTNGAGNPTNYTYGVGVSSFADADKEGYTFDGWYSDAGFTKKVTKISDSQSGNVTLYAKFEANRYGIQYELNGGTNGAGNPESYTYGKGVSGFADASKEGYTFDGWYSDETYTTKVTGISADQQGDVTIYAKFSETGSGDVTPATYQISYELNGGTNGAGNPTSYIYGKGVTGFADAVKEGYTFDGWYGDAGFTKKVTSISDSQTGDVTLYAKFEANRYGIQYELDGGTNGAGNPESYIYGKGVTGFADAVKEGYVFRGWYSDADFTTPLTSISERQIGRVTLYAKYAKKYAITYVLDGGTNARENPESYVVGTGVAQFADAVKEGYTFEGWYGDAGFTTKVTDISATQVGDVTLYAKFVAEKEEDSEIEDEDGKKSKKKKTDGLSDDAPKGDKSLRDARGDNPETGDNSPIALGFWIFAISGLAILFLRRYIVRLKKKN